MKNILSSIVEVLFLMFVSTGIAFVASFMSVFSTTTVFFVIFPIASFIRIAMLKSNLSPLEEKIKYLQKENENKDKVIKKFLEDNNVNE